MLSCKLAVLPCALALLLPGQAPAQGPDAPPKPTKNAALKYWQAFVLVPRLSEAQVKVLYEEGNLKDPEVPKLLDACKDALHCLHLGARLPQCDWGLNYEEGPGSLMPHISKARELINLAVLRACYRCEQGKYQEAVDDALDGLALARHIGTDGLLISLIVQYAVEVRVQTEFAVYLPRLDAAALQKLAAGLDALPPGGTLRKGLKSEKEIAYQWLVGRLKDQPGRALVDIEQAAVAAAGGPKGALKQLEELEPVYDEMARLLACRYEEFPAKFAELRGKTAGNAFAKMILPAFEKCAIAEARGRANRELFRAAIAVVQGGPEKLKAIPDPYGDGPFEYRALDPGFELKSKLVVLNQQISLKVGQPRK
jgi:hypothetical protein